MADQHRYPPAHGDEAELFRAFNDELMRTVGAAVGWSTPQVIEDACAFAWAKFMQCQPDRSKNWRGWLFTTAQREAWQLEGFRRNLAYLDAATAPATLHALFIAVVAGFLAAIGFATPALPLLVAAAVVVDVGAHRRWSPLLMATWWTAALHVAYVPVRNLLGDGVRFDTADIAASAGLTWIAALAVFVVAADDYRPLPRGRARAYLVVVLTLAIAPSAMAHDPGQGDDAGTVGMTVVVGDGTAKLTAQLPGATCGSTKPVAIVARRGGRSVNSELEKNGCVLSGDVRLDERGRWFVYAVMERQGQTVESWLPARSRESSTRARDPRRYAYFASGFSSGVVQTVAGVTLCAAMLALLAATWLLERASRRTSYTASE